MTKSQAFKLAHARARVAQNVSGKLSKKNVTYREAFAFFLSATMKETSKEKQAEAERKRIERENTPNIVRFYNSSTYAVNRNFC